MNGTKAAANASFPTNLAEMPMLLTTTPMVLMMSVSGKLTMLTGLLAVVDKPPVTLAQISNALLRSGNGVEELSDSGLLPLDVVAHKRIEKGYILLIYGLILYLYKVIIKK